MRKFFIKAKNFFLDILFPIFCLGCGKEGEYLCQDCQALADICQYQYCPFCFPPKIVLDGKTCKSCKKTKNLSGLFSAASYQNPLVKKTIERFKYEPSAKELAKPLASLIVAHFQILGKEQEDIKSSLLIPVPLAIKKLKKRGFNQAEEIAKELSKAFGTDISANALVKTKNTPSQTELSGKEREINIKGVFLCEKPEVVTGRKIFLVDDVFTTGSTMEECAKILKLHGAKEVWGITAARG